MIASQNIKPTKSKSNKVSARLATILSVTGILSVLAIALAVFLGGGSEKAEEKGEPRRTTIAEHKAAMVAKMEAATGKPFDVPTLDRDEALEAPVFYTNKLGEVKRRTGKQIVLVSSKRRKLFTNQAEEQLSGIVNTPLGANFYDYDVPDDFAEKFAHSLTNKIEITDADSDEEAAEKQRVIDAKETLRQAWQRGEDIVAIMREEKRVMKEKFESYIMFEQGLNEMRAAGADEDEIAEYALAAKMMMKQQDIEHPLALGINEADAMNRLEKLINPRESHEEEDEYEENDD